MTLKVKIIAGYLLLNVASLLTALILIHDYAKATGGCEEVVARNLLIVIGLVNFAATIILAKMFLRRITAGLNRIVETVGSISGGTFSQTLPTRDDEDGVGFLGKTFERMAEKLEEIVRETKRSEEKYSTLLENASDGILIIEDQKFVFANRTFLRIMGYTKEELIGTDYLHIVAPESVELLRERHTKRLLGLDVPTITEARFIDRYGEGHYFEVNAGLVERSDGKAVLVILRDIMESKEYETSLKKLSRQVLKTQEEERRRISRELHDEIGQALSAMNISIEILLRNGVQLDFREKRLRDVKNLIEKSIDDVHRITYDLRPYHLDNFGLVPAVRSYAETFAERTGVEVALQTEGEWSKLDPAVETAVYRVIQEALTNISKYAEAKRAFVSMTRVPESMEIIIEDNGKGFSTEPEKKKGSLMKGGLGLFGIGERVSGVGGSFSITSTLGVGTRLVIRIPVPRDSIGESTGHEQDQNSPR
jgi:two-component system sensor histidine kinase NreB